MVIEMDTFGEVVLIFKKSADFITYFTKTVSATVSSIREGFKIFLSPSVSFFNKAISNAIEPKMY